MLANSFWLWTNLHFSVFYLCPMNVLIARTAASLRSWHSSALESVYSIDWSLYTSNDFLLGSLAGPGSPHPPHSLLRTAAAHPVRCHLLREGHAGQAKPGENTRLRGQHPGFPPRTAPGGCALRIIYTEPHLSEGVNLGSRDTGSETWLCPSLDVCLGENGRPIRVEFPGGHGSKKPTFFKKMEHGKDHGNFEGRASRGGGSRKGALTPHVLVAPPQASGPRPLCTLPASSGASHSPLEQRVRLPRHDPAPAHGD